MAFFRTLIGGTLFLILLGLVFWIAFSNAEPVLTLKLAGLSVTGNAFPNPFASIWGTPLAWPFSAWLITFALIGMVFGLVVGWFLGGGTRVRARQQGRRARRAEKELKTMQSESEAAKSEIDSLKDEKKNLETQMKTTEDLSTPSEVKQITNS